MIVDIPNVGPVEFPDTMSEAEVQAAVQRLHAQANPPEEKESPELFGALTGGAGAIGAAGDVLFSKGRPIFRAAEKLFGFQDPNLKVQPRKFSTPAEVAERGIGLRTPPDMTTATENYMKSGQYISPEGKPLFYGAGEEGGYSGARKAAERAIETEQMYPEMKVLQGKTPLAVPREEAMKIEAERAEAKRLQDIKNQQEINRIAQLRAERLSERQRLKGSEARGKLVSGSQTIGSKVGAPIIGGYELGSQAAQAYNRLTREDLQPSDIAAGAANIAGAGMGGYSALPISRYRLPLAVGSVGLNYLSDILDLRNPRRDRSVLEDTQKKAVGGLIHLMYGGLVNQYANGGQVATPPSASPSISAQLADQTPPSLGLPPVHTIDLMNQPDSSTTRPLVGGDNPNMRYTQPFKEGGHTTPAWQRAEGKNPEGGLNAIGRASYKRETGGELKPPVSAKAAKSSPKKAARRKSFCARMSGNPGPMKDEKGRPTRKALALKKWDC